MVLDELLELNATVMGPMEAKNSIINMLKIAKNCSQMTTANQAEIVRSKRMLWWIFGITFEYSSKKRNQFKFGS